MVSGNHEHCLNCFKNVCTNTESCRMLFCANNCGFQMHACKEQDHLQICLNQKTHCINKDYGCETVLQRHQLKTHLTRCPASVIVCTMEWNRYPLYSKSRLHWVPFYQPNPVLVRGQLDVELALRDQRVVIDSFKKRIRKGKTRVETIRGRNSGILEGRIDTMAMALTLSMLESKLKLPAVIQSGNKKMRGVEKEGDEEDPSFEDRVNSFIQCTNDKNEISVLELEVGENNTHARLMPLGIDSTSIQDTSGMQVDTGIEEEPSTTMSSSPEKPCVHSGGTLGLNVMIETLPKFQRQHPMYTIACNQVFRRDEYGPHFKNVHSDIHGGVNGWLDQRCPLAQYGCTFVRQRLKPFTQTGRIVFNPELDSIGVRPQADEDDSLRIHCGKCGRVNQCSHLITCKSDTDYLTSLPMEILEGIASWLDSFTLCNLACSCKTFYAVVQSLLNTKGAVILKWEKRRYENGSFSWKVKNKHRFFTTSFSAVDDWIHSDTASMSAHLEKCAFFDHLVSSKPFSYYHADHEIQARLSSKCATS